ncbi:MAG: hypothetical protein JNK87_35610 [Bryobacterales bacterium]|nr:hypothetical protein [Bryobacterales bacterium]
MTKKQLKALEKTGTAALPALLADMTAVLARHGIAGMEVVTFEMASATPFPKPAVNTAMTAPAHAPKPPARGCVMLPDGTIFCG